MPIAHPSIVGRLLGRKTIRRKVSSKEELDAIAATAEKQFKQLDFSSYVSPNDRNLGVSRAVDKPVSAIAYRRELLSIGGKKKRKSFGGRGGSVFRSENVGGTGRLVGEEDEERDERKLMDVEEEFNLLMNEFLKLEERVKVMEPVEVLEEKLGTAKNQVTGKEKALALAKRKMEAATKMAEANAAGSSPSASAGSMSLRSPRSPTGGSNALVKKSSSIRRALSSVRRSVSGRSMENLEIEDIGLLDEEFWNCFRVNVDEALKIIEMDVKQAQEEFEYASELFGEAETLLQDRRAIDFRLIDIMDRFYGKEPGFEEDQVALKMVEECDELSSEGREAEEGRYKLLKLHQQISTALRDQENALEHAHSALLLYKEIVEHLKESRTYNRIDVFTEGNLSRQASLKVKELWVESDKKATVANRKAKIAHYFSPEAPIIRTADIGQSNLIGTLDIVFDSIPVDVMVKKTVSQTYERALESFKDSEKTVRWLVEYSSKVRCHLDECKANIERWDRLLLKERADIFHRNHRSV